MMTAVCPVHDDFQRPKQKSNKKNSNKNLPRVYIGNLPIVGISESILRKELSSLSSTAAEIASIQIKKNKHNCHAFVTCNSNKEIVQLISSLHQKQFQGKKLIVQREQRKSNNNHNNNNNNNNNNKRGFGGGGGGGGSKFGNSNTNNFGGGGWSKPEPSAAVVPPAPSDDAEEKTEAALSENPLLGGGQDPDSIMASVIHDEMQAATTQDDVFNTTIASLAAVSFLAPVMMTNQQEDNDESKQQQKQEEDNETAANKNDDPKEAGETNEGGGFDFMSRCKKPLSELLADYGEEDPNWQSVQPTEADPSPANGALPPIERAPESVTVDNKSHRHHQPQDAAAAAAAASPQPSENRLGRHGKAPIHVEFVSFGYIHGAPSAIRNGWSHAQPLPVLDVGRGGDNNNDDDDDDDDDEDKDDWCLPPVPGHLAWRDGTSGWIQKVVLGDPQTRNRTKSFAQNVFTALQEAIDDGKHGYVSPLQIKIYVGSETGRHRSVVICEQTAKQLRNLLRQNQNNTITVPISVGTYHRDLEQRKQQQQGGNNKNRKNKKDDDDLDSW